MSTDLASYSKRYNAWLGGVSSGKSQRPSLSGSYNAWFDDMRSKSNFIPKDIGVLKPASYNYLATYKPETFATAASTKTSLELGTKYHKPTEKVGEGILRNFAVWEDIKNLGGKVASHGGNLLGKLVDVVSTPGYMIRAVQKSIYENEYMKPDSAGGTDVTAIEHLKAAWRVWSPAGWVANLNSPTKELDAATRGLAWKEKTSNVDLIKMTEPEFAKKYPKTTMVAGIGGDILLDPITFVTMGANPGSITRAGKAGLQLASFNKAAAAKTLKNTYFTSTGRNSARETVRSDLLLKELNRINRKTDKAVKRAGKAAKNKNLTYRLRTQAHYEKRAAEYAARAATAIDDDLKGMALAMRIAKKSLNPLNAMTIASRYSTGARAGTAIVEGTATIRGMASALHAEMVKDLASVEHYQILGQIDRKDFEYSHAGRKFVIHFSKAKSVEEYLMMLVQEASPVAKYQEFNARHARQRKGNIVSTEGRGTAFIRQWQEHSFDVLKKGMTPSELKEAELFTSFEKDILASKVASKAAIDDEATVNLKEEDLDNIDFDSLHNDVINAWTTNKTSRYNEAHAVVIVDFQGQARKVKLSVIKKHAQARQAEAARDMGDAAIAAARTASDRAVDALSGVGDGVAVARERYVRAYRKLMAEREALAGAVESAKVSRKAAKEALKAAARAKVAAEETADTANTALDEALALAGDSYPNEYQNELYNTLLYIIDDAATSIPAEKLKAYQVILSDESIPLDQRVAKIIADETMDNESAEEIVEALFDVKIDDQYIKVTMRGETPVGEQIPAIVRAVLQQRWDERVSASAGRSRVSGVRMENGVLKVGKDTDIQYTRDVNGEVAMAVLDSVRAALQYAAKQDMMNDPEQLFGAIGKTVDEFLNEATADIKIQVTDLMFNMFGLKLPTSLTPSILQIDELFGGDKYLAFTDILKANGQAADSSVIRNHFSEAMQEWVFKAFPFFKKDDYRLRKPDGTPNTYKPGYDFGRLNTDMAALGRDGRLPEGHFVTPRQAETNARLVTTIRALKKVIESHVGYGVNQYTMADVLLYAEEILAAHKTTLRIKDVAGGKKLGTLNIGRLSALDSFNFLDDDVIKGFEAILELRRIASSTDPAKQGAALAANKSLASLFINEANGLDYIASLSDIDNIRFADHFKSLGIHAKLKEDGLNTGSFGAKFAAQLMEKMWKTPTINHEFQKAVHNSILGESVVNGLPPETVAERTREAIDEFFKAHDNLKRLIYPINPRTGQPYANATLKNYGKNLQERFDTSPLDTETNRPAVTTESPGEVKFASGKDSVAKEDFEEINLVGLTPDKVTIALRDYGFDEKFLSGRGFQVKDIEALGNQGAAPSGRFKPISGTNNVRVSKVHKVGDDAFVLRYSDGSRTQFDLLITKNPETGKYDTPYKFVTGTPAEMANKLNKGLKNVERGPRNINYPAETYAATTFDRKINVTKQAAPTRTPEGMASLSGTETMQVVNDIEKVMDARKANEAADAANAEFVRAGEDLINKKAVEKTAKDELAAKDAEIQAENAAMAKIEADANEAAATSTATDEAAAPSTAADETPTDPDREHAESNGLYTDEEIAILRDFIQKSYTDTPPELVYKSLESLSKAMAQDLMLAQARIVTDLHWANIKHSGNVRIAGLPFMDTMNPMNNTHAIAGVTAMEQKRGRAFNLWNRLSDYSVHPNKPLAKLRRYTTKQSHAIDMSLNRIRSGVVNGVAEKRKALLKHLNAIYKAVNKGDYVTPSVKGMSRKERFRYINAQVFDQAKMRLSGTLDEFNLADGSNPVREILADLERISSDAFTADTFEGLKTQIRQFNVFLDKKFKFTEQELENIFENMRSGMPLDPDKVMPFTQEWIAFVSKNFPSSAWNMDTLKTRNLAEMHYAFGDAALRLEEGRILKDAVWNEFAFIQSAENVKFYNEQVQPFAVDPSTGQPVRGKWVNIKDIAKPTHPSHIEEKYIPLDYRGNDVDFYIQEDFVKEIRVLFKYMDTLDTLNDTVNIGWLRKILNYFKASVTVYKLPAYPVRNLLADVFLGAMDGLVNPRYYQRSARIMWDVHKGMKEVDIRTMGNMLDQKFMDGELMRAAHDPNLTTLPEGGGKVAVTLLTEDGKVELTAHQVMRLYNEYGLGQNRVSGNIQESLAGSRLTGFGQAAGKAHDTLRTLNDVREDWGRVAHFIYALENEAALGGDIRMIAMRAKDRVFKYHFDYGDVSIFERKTLAQWLPFYKWVKNIIPLTLASVVTKPAALKADIGITKAVGAMINDNPDDPQTDFVIPDYIENEMAVPVGWYADPNGNRFNQWASVSLPLSETFARTIAPTIDPWIDPSIIAQGMGTSFEESGSGLMTTFGSMLNPLAKGFIQGTTGDVLWPTGAQPERADDSWMKTMTAVIPGYATLDDLTRSAKKISNQISGDSTDLNAQALFWSELGFMSLRNNTEGTQLGELKRLENANRGQKDKLMNEMIDKFVAKYPQATPDQAKEIINVYLKDKRTASSTLKGMNVQ